MIKVFYLPLCAVLLLLRASVTFAQTSPTDMADAKGSKSGKTASFKIGVNYLNNNVFMGRADTTRTPTITPDVKYTFQSGVYLSAAVYYIPNRLKNKLDGGSISAGYDYTVNDNLEGGVSFSKLFYNSSSTQIGSSISSTFNANLDYDIADIITPSITAEYDIIKQAFGNDVFINLGLSHDFVKEGLAGDKDLLIVSPSVSVNTGTQNFYDAYLSLKKYKLTAKATAKEPAAKKLLTAQEEKLSKFNLLDYEFSVPVEYKAGHVILSFIPTYAVAENKLPARISSGFVTSPGIFYFETGAALKF